MIALKIVVSACRTQTLSHPLTLNNGQALVEYVPLPKPLKEQLKLLVGLKIELSTLRIFRMTVGAGLMNSHSALYSSSHLARSNLRCISPLVGRGQGAW